VIPADFDYAAPDSLEEVTQLLVADDRDAKLLAGGHSLLPLMKLRLAAPDLLVDLRRIPAMGGVERRNGDFVIGALTCHSDVASAGELGVAAQAAGLIADRQVRNRGTIGGSLAHGDPASDLPAVILAADGIVVVRGAGGGREIAAGALFLEYLTTALEPGEVITHVRLPPFEGYGFRYEKFTRRAEDWAMVGVCALVAARNGTCEDVRVALVNMGSTPERADAVERTLLGGPVDAQAIARAAEHAADDTDPPAELNATPEYKRHLARVLTRRALEHAVREAAPEPVLVPRAPRERLRIESRAPPRPAAGVAADGAGTNLRQSFDVGAALQRVWAGLVDVEQVAPCLPGAEVAKVAEGIYEGTFRVKIGPTTAAYSGRLEFESADEATHTLAMRATGQDTRGGGSASARIAVQLSEAAERTHVEVETDYTITGKLARFGRSGMIKDVADMLMKEFAVCLERRLGSEHSSVPTPGRPVNSVLLIISLVAKRAKRFFARVLGR
jgi:carbon-monoxide dehydrogenase medium subunit